MKNLSGPALCAAPERNQRRFNRRPLPHSLDPETLALLKDNAQHDGDPNMRFTAVEELARGWKDDPEVQAFLRELKKR